MLGEEGKDMIYALHQMNQKVKVNIAVEQAYMELAEQMDLEEACAFGRDSLICQEIGRKLWEKYSEDRHKVRGEDEFTGGDNDR